MYCRWAMIVYYILSPVNYHKTQNIYLARKYFDGLDSFSLPYTCLSFFSRLYSINNSYKGNEQLTALITVTVVLTELYSPKVNKV